MNDGVNQERFVIFDQERFALTLNQFSREWLLGSEHHLRRADSSSANMWLLLKTTQNHMWPH